MRLGEPHSIPYIPTTISKVWVEINPRTSKMFRHTDHTRFGWPCIPIQKFSRVQPGIKPRTFGMVVRHANYYTIKHTLHLAVDGNCNKIQ